jgi:GNAT superfamily N-acetyltransferase
MAISRRKYQSSDYDAVVDFLRTVYLDDVAQPYWLPQRFEYAEFLISPLHKDRGYPVDWKETIYLWLDEDKIVGIDCSESPNENIFLHINRNYRQLEQEMIVFAEKEIITKTLSKSEIKIWACEGDIFREELLMRNSYTKQDEVEFLNWRDLRKKLPAVQLPDGYAIHDMVDESGLDVQHKIDQITKAFDSKSYPLPVLRTMQSGPSYRKDLDLFVKDKTGEPVSFATLWVDSALNVAYIEPVATDAGHRRLGLGKALLAEGLRRLENIRVSKAYVGAAGMDRMNFYRESGFDERVALNSWKKQITS